MADFWARFSAPLPAAACKPNNASALFGPGPSFTGLTAVDLNYAREWRAPPKKKEPRKLRRSNSDIAVRRKSLERRKSRDLNKDLSEPTQIPNGGCRTNGSFKGRPRPKSISLSDSTGHVSRYPLVIPGNDSQAQVKPRGETQKSSSPCGTKQSGSPGQRIRPPRRSASFSSPRKPSTSEGNTSPRGTGNQPRITGAFRREKSDVIKLRNGNSRTGSEISKQTRSYSSSSLTRKTSGVVSPRSQATGSKSSFGFRREKSDVIRTRRASQTPSPTNTRHQGIQSRESPQSLHCRSASNVSDTSSSGSDMSKIPSLKRAPVATGKPQAQISRIPSLTRQQHAPVEHARTPPKSKIPSISKADKKSQIPTGSKKSQDSSGPKPSRIPSFSSPQGRPDSAKENQDPSASENNGLEQRQDEASSESKTRIPSFSKKSRIPTLPRKDSDVVKPSEATDDAEDGAQNGEAEHVTNGDTEPSAKVKKSSVSRIPSLTRPGAPKEEFKPKSNIPSPMSAPAPKVPSSSVSKIPEPKPVVNGKSVPTSLPIASKPSGIPKPGSVQSPSGIPKPNGLQSPVTQSTSGIPTPAGEQLHSQPATQAQSKLPGLSRKVSTGKAAPSKLPSFSGATATRKTSDAEKAKDAAKKDAEPSKTTSENVQETEDSPTHMCIAYEAQKVEQLLREGQVVVEVPVDVQGEEEAEEEKEEEEKPDDSTEKTELSTQDEKLISDVLESYAPELANKENVPILDNKVLDTAKISNQNTEGRLSFDDIYIQAFENEMAKAKREDSKTQADTSETAKSKKEESEGKKFGTQSKEAEPRTPDDEAKSAEVQAVDTLGGYEQQSRRTRSRQRKMVSDTEESENEQSASKEEPKKGIDKDKYGTSPFDAEKKTKENTKPSKSKSKNEKSKFVVESSLGKEFYESKKTESKESISGLPTVNKPEQTAVVIENKNSQELASTSPAVETNEAVEFEDIELNSVEDRREITRSVPDDLDERTVQCIGGCGRGGKCSIM